LFCSSASCPLVGAPAFALPLFEDEDDGEELLLSGLAYTVTVLGVGSGVAVTVTTDGEDEGEALLLLVAADAADDDEECDT